MYWDDLANQKIGFNLVPTRFSTRTLSPITKAEHTKINVEIKPKKVVIEDVKKILKEKQENGFVFSS